MDVGLSFGHILKQRRKALALTQRQLAARVGCATVTIQRIEQGNLRPSSQIVQRLADIFDLPPDEAIRFQRLARAEAVEQTPGAGVVSPAPLPASVTSLIGRVHEVAAVCTRLADPAVRLVTLIGTGGVGKTRLALQVAADLQGDFADGAVFVDLAPVADPNLVVHAIAQALAVREVGDQPLQATLSQALRDQHRLLVLDNFEQVLDAAELVAALLRAAPKVKVLLTSRVVVGVYGEHLVEVPPLAYPDLAALPALEQLLEYEAIRLFADRARALHADFALGVDNARAVAAICAHLDGLPLAIELAAARIRLFPPATLLARLVHRLPVLTGGPRTLPARQQTLRATLDWSYVLLNADQQRVFARCAVFAGGFFLAAAEAVCADLDLAVPVLDVIHALVEQGLVQRVPLVNRPPAALPEPGPRFTMLETIREYALERLAATGTLDEVRGRHTAYVLQFAETVEPELLGPDNMAWLVWLNIERDNFRTALQWSASAPAGAALSLRLGTALWRFWDLWDRREGRGWLERELERQRPVPPAVHARALGRAAEFAVRQGDLLPAGAWAEASLHYCRALDDRRGSAFALHVLGLAAQHRGDEAQAEALWSESLDLFRSVGDGWGQGMALMWLASMAVSRHAYRRAELFLAEARDHFEQAGDTVALAWVVGRLGRVASVQGQHARGAIWYRQAVQRFLRLTEVQRSPRSFRAAGMFARLLGETAHARELLDVALGLARDSGDTIETANALRELARMAEDQGDTAEAENLWQESLDWGRQASDRIDVLDALVGLGTNANTQGHIIQAHACFTEALELVRNEPRARFATVRCVLGLAVNAWGAKRPVRAARLGGAADAATARREWLTSSREMDGRPLHDRLLARLRQEIANEGLAPLWAASQAMTLEQAIAYALDDGLQDSTTTDVSS